MSDETSPARSPDIATTATSLWLVPCSQSCGPLASSVTAPLGQRANDGDTYEPSTPSGPRRDSDSFAHQSDEGEARSGSSQDNMGTLMYDTAGAQERFGEQQRGCNHLDGRREAWRSEDLHDQSRHTSLRAPASTIPSSSA